MSSLLCLHCGSSSYDNRLVSGIDPNTAYADGYLEALDVPCPGQPPARPVKTPRHCDDCATTTSITSSISQVPWFTGGYDQPYVQTVTATVDGPSGSFPTVSDGQLTFSLADNGPVAQQQWSYPAFATGANTGQCAFVVTDMPYGTSVTSPCDGNSNVVQRRGEENGEEGNRGTGVRIVTRGC
jgi:hypothetical protein